MHELYNSRVRPSFRNSANKPSYDDLLPRVYRDTSVFAGEMLSIVMLEHMPVNVG